MFGNILLIASFLIFMAVVLEAKIKSDLGFFIAMSGFIIGILNLLYVIAQFV